MIFNYSQHPKTTEFDYVYLKNLLQGYAQPRRMIHELIKKREIIRIKKGLYVLNPEYATTLPNKFHLANLIYGPSYISMQSALSYYQLIPEKTLSTLSINTKRKKSFQTPIGDFQYEYVPLHIYSIGFTQTIIDNTPIIIATPEKALLDLIWKEKKTLDFDNINSFFYDDLRLKHTKWNQSRLKLLSKSYGDKYVTCAVRALLKDGR